ncbi:MAG: ATP-binding protein, partial [Clostridiaceae bacterium]
EASFVVIYGRRRVGKTTLIKEFIKDKNSVYFLANEEIESENQKKLQEEMAEYLNQDFIRDITFKNWDGIFKLIPEGGDGKRLVLVIDEFQYLCMTNKAFPSIFQRIWDEELKKKNIMVIVCGSYMNMMEGLTLSYTSPLYGRRTAQIKLAPLSFNETKEFYDNLSFEEQVKRFSITGGVPKYIEVFRENQNLMESIEKNILNSDSFLYEEPNFLLKNEVEKPITYLSILKSIAAGNHKMGNISTSLSIPGSTAGKYLSILQGLDIVVREVPVTEENAEKSKKGLYFIKDNFINFWFKFVFPYTSYLEMGRTEYVMKVIERNLIDSHISFVFEKVCAEMLWEMELPFQPLKVGRWWDSSEEIDVVAINTFENSILFGECKFWDNMVGVNVLNKLKEKAKKVKCLDSSRKEYFIIFSKSGFTEELLKCQNDEDVFLITW